MAMVYQLNWAHSLLKEMANKKRKIPGNGVPAKLGPQFIERNSQ